LRLTLNKIDGTQKIQLLQNEINTHEIGTCCLGASKNSKDIMELLFDPGHYRVSVETLYVSPELGNTPINFEIGFTHSGK
jgi:hypothetical protein